MKLRALLAASILLTSLAVPAQAAGPAGRAEEFTYSWRIRGALGWLAGLKFPNHGIGALRNVPAGGDRFESELVIRGRQADEGQYVYRSEIDRGSLATLTTSYGYQWDGRKREEQTRFDYDKGLARTRKEREDTADVETKVKKIPAGEMRDVLTGIHFLRKNASSIRGSVSSNIYSDGTLYPVIFRSIGERTLDWSGKPTRTRGFEITSAPSEGKKWPGGVKVWLTDDEQAIPLRIEIQRSVAAVQLDLQAAR